MLRFRAGVFRKVSLRSISLASNTISCDIATIPQRKPVRTLPAGELRIACNNIHSGSLSWAGRWQSAGGFERSRQRRSGSCGNCWGREKMRQESVPRHPERVHKFEECKHREHQHCAFRLKIARLWSGFLLWLSSTFPPALIASNMHGHE
jgi:hypothetical protein